MSTLNIRLFGRLSIRSDEQPVENLEIRKVQELFCYLLLKRERPHSRETLADTLWPDSPAVKKNLRQVLWQLQSALGSQTEPGQNALLLVEPDWIQINPAAPLWLDIAEFEQAYNQVQGIPGHELDEPQIELLREAVGFYQGDLLEGWYQDWCLYERERFHNIYLAMLDKLMDYYEAHEDYETGLIYGLRILCHDRARERTHRRLMRLHFMSGDRAAALRQYERCVDALEQELGVPPSRRTMVLYEQIRADELIGTVLTSSDDNKGFVALANSPLPDVFEHLKQLQAILLEIQRLLHQDIAALESYMANNSPVPLVAPMPG